MVDPVIGQRALQRLGDVLLADHVGKRVRSVATIERQWRSARAAGDRLAEQRLLLLVDVLLVAPGRVDVRLVQQRFVHASTICLAADTPSPRSVGIRSEPNRLARLPRVDLRWLLLDADGVMQRVRDGWLDELTAHGGEQGEEFVLAVFAAEVACLTGDDFGAAIREVAKRFEIDSPLEMITASQYWIDVDPTMIGAIRALRKLGVRCALATNQQNLRGGYMRRSLGFGEVFDEQFYSHELGVAKPDPGYFRAILARIEVPAETVLFLDDRDENVEGAVAAGLPAEVFPRDGGAEALRAILARHGVRL